MCGLYLRESLEKLLNGVNATNALRDGLLHTLEKKHAAPAIQEARSRSLAAAAR